MDDCCASKPEESCIKSTKTVLFAPFDSKGHINSLLGMAGCLRARGHRTVFLFHDPIDGGLKEAGHEVYDCSTEGLIESQEIQGAEGKWEAMMDQFSKNWSKPILENVLTTTPQAFRKIMELIKTKDESYARKLKLIKPDVIIVDNFFIQPAIMKHGKPWARVQSAAPLMLHPYGHRLPRYRAGLPTNWMDTKDQEKLAEYTAIMNAFDQMFTELHKEWNDYLVGVHSIPRTPIDPASFIHSSTHLNVYMYPEELDYDIPLEGWIRCESILRINDKLPGSSDDLDSKSKIPKFEIPARLKDKPGRMIFLSMGTLASSYVDLMKRLVSILAKSPHRFIVSKGVNGDRYELADNMWGEKFLPQLSILPEIDLIITHGGNNTITECMYFGVPGFIVSPMFGDQLDNAQRIEECGLGRRVDVLTCSEDKLLTAIDEVLAMAPNLRPRMKATSKRMQEPDNKYKANKLFTEFVESN